MAGQGTVGAAGSRIMDFCKLAKAAKDLGCGIRTVSQYEYGFRASGSEAYRGNKVCCEAVRGASLTLGFGEGRLTKYRLKIVVVMATAMAISSSNTNSSK